MIRVNYQRDIKFWVLKFSFAFCLAVIPQILLSDLKITPIKANQYIEVPEDELKEEYVPLFKVVPIYPRRAQQRGTMGYALVEFTITETGNVEDVEFIEGYCGNPLGPEENMRECSIFESSSVQAAKKLKYKPKIIEGEAVSVDEVLHKFVYILDI